MSKLKSATIEACRLLGLKAESDFIWNASDGGKCRAVVRIPSVGAKYGMLIFTSYYSIDPYIGEMIDSGFGFSVQSEPSEREEFDLELFKEMFADWGWDEHRQE